MSEFNSNAEICLEIVKLLGSKDRLFLFFDSNDEDDNDENVDNDEDDDEECNCDECRCTDEAFMFLEEDNETALARIKVAIDFSKRSKAFQLRALVEQWDAVTLTREMY